MARVTHVKHANKDYPNNGIVKGQEYWWTKHAYGPKLFFTSPPKQSQLTQSEFLSQAYDLEERIGSLDAKDFETLEDLKSEVESIVDDIRALGEEQQEHHDNMPEGLQDGDIGQLLEQRSESMEDWASSLESEAESLDDDDDEESDDKDKSLKDRIAEAIEAVQGASSPDIE
jgi:hypothetical protein